MDAADHLGAAERLREALRLWSGPAVARMRMADRCGRRPGGWSPAPERLWGQYMLVLHRSGRRSEALRAYRRIRTTLVREFGLEPSAIPARPRPGPRVRWGRRPRAPRARQLSDGAHGGPGRGVPDGPARRGSLKCR
uniref:BTAD domain-containing putative transcriptional regulator n=1 Tax=Streptomyces canus TaxID=58343 RepID=UPI0027D835CC|nr:BTAD domain-containing putative transcriptional regulator [Streptomyces canus]